MRESLGRAADKPAVSDAMLSRAASSSYRYVQHLLIRRASLVSLTVDDPGFEQPAMWHDYKPHPTEGLTTRPGTAPGHDSPFWLRGYRYRRGRAIATLSRAADRPTIVYTTVPGSTASILHITVAAVFRLYLAHKPRYPFASRSLR